MGNVIDISARLKGHNSVANSGANETAAVVDISDVRNQMIREDRRNVKRTILTEFISVHSVVPGYGVMRVALYDINEQGLSFDLDSAHGRYNVGDPVELRVYLNHATYFRIETKVAHITDVPEEGVGRHGCEFVHGSANEEALHHFIRFLESVTASLRRDGGDILVTKINS